MRIPVDGLGKVPQAAVSRLPGCTHHHDLADEEPGRRLRLLHREDRRIDRCDCGSWRYRGTCWTCDEGIG